MVSDGVRRRGAQSLSCAVRQIGCGDGLSEALLAVGVPNNNVVLCQAYPSGCTGAVCMQVALHNSMVAQHDGEDAVATPYLLRCNDAGELAWFPTALRRRGAHPLSCAVRQIGGGDGLSEALLAVGETCTTPGLSMLLRRRVHCCLPCCCIAKALW